MGAIRFAGKFGKYAKNTFTEKSINGRTLNNLYSGRDLNKKGMALAGIGIAAYAGYQIDKGESQMRSDERLARGGDPDMIQSLPGTRADGVAYNASPYNGPQLEATGDLVFALHKIRHGG